MDFEILRFCGLVLLVSYIFVKYVDFLIALLCSVFFTIWLLSSLKVKQSNKTLESVGIVQYSPSFVDSQLSDSRIINLSVLTYNVFCLPWFLDNSGQGRMRRICQSILELPECHVVCLQEVWTKECAEIAQDQLKDKYPYFVPVSGKHWLPLVGQESGLFVASQFPILAAYFGHFGNHIGSDMLAAKGALFCVLQVGEEKVILTNLHGQADQDHLPLWWLTSYAPNRISQIHQENYESCCDWLSKLAIEHDAPYCILAGDFNISAENNQGIKTCDYQSLLDLMDRHSKISSACDIFRTAHPSTDEHPCLTYDPQRNGMCASYDNSCGRMDMGFFLQFENEPITPKLSSEILDNWFFSDHFPVLLSVNWKLK